MTTPLLTRTETLAALETLAASADSELIFAFRSFSPETPLLTEALRERGLSTWADLIPWLTRRGVRLFMAFGDEDPLLDSARHRRAWLAASGFANVAQGDAQILCVPHGQMAGALWRWRLRRPLRRALLRLKQDEARHLTLPQRAALSGSIRLRSQHINQSFAVADGTSALIGGFTLDARRPETLWHDVSALVQDADFAGALRAHFSDCWTAAMATGAPALATPPRPFLSVTRRQSRPELRLLRTLSDPASGPWRLTGEPRDTSFATQVTKRLSEARQSVFIETAAFRSPMLTDALVRAAHAAPDLQVVVILHPGADRQPLGGAPDDTGAQAATLQAEALSRLVQAFGPRLVLKDHRLPGAGTPTATPDPLPGRLLIVDETWAVIGSHDLTNRALSLDTEASVLIRDPGFAADLLRRRSDHWLGRGPDHLDAADWTEAAPPLHRHDPRHTARSRARPLPDLLY